MRPTGFSPSCPRPWDLSSPVRDQTCSFCIGGRILNPCGTREVLLILLSAFWSLTMLFPRRGDRQTCCLWGGPEKSTVLRSSPTAAPRPPAGPSPSSLPCPHPQAR